MIFSTFCVSGKPFASHTNDVSSPKGVLLSLLLSFPLSLWHA